MKNKNIVILDFDGTLYSGENLLAKLPKHVKKGRRDFFPNLTDEEYAIIEKENPHWKKVYDGAEIVDCIYEFKKKYPSFNIAIKDFWNWQNENPDPIDVENADVVSPKVIEKVCEKFSVYVVSNSSTNHIKYYMDVFGINQDLFKQIVSNKFTAKDRTKKHYYQSILEKENCNPCNAHVFGDSTKNDLEPAQELGMNTHHVSDVKDLEKELKKLIKKTN